jgi:hypothetical protein
MSLVEKHPSDPAPGQSKCAGDRRRSGPWRRGQSRPVRTEVTQVLDAAYLAHPERFVRKPPTLPKLPGTSWINPPPDKETGTQ